VDALTKSIVVDTHTHSTTYLPRLPAGVFRSVVRDHPPDVTFADAFGAGVHAIVAKAVGDPLVTRWHLRSPFQAVQNQLASIRDESAAAGARLVRTAGEVRSTADDGMLGVILGLEGADCVGTDLGLLAQLARDGVRVIVPVHLGDNQIGTTCLPWQKYLGPIPVRRQPEGLTTFGVEFVKAMNDLGVVIDGSHADEPTLMGMIEHSSAPVICSHAGARAVSNFERYLSDDAIRAAAGIGGVIGLWPYYMSGKGTPTLDAVAAHARHVADLVGPQHVCLGTDMNGVPGLADGYRSEKDVPLIAKHLSTAGFSDTEVDGIMGENFLRVLEAVAR
jgi:membrane dipeptidase